MKKKKRRDSFFRRLIGWLHLWLGLITGAVIFIVCITGCFYAFEQEIRDVLEPWRFVEAQDRDFVPPSRLIDTATAHMPGYKPTGLTYAGKEGAAAVGFEYKEGGVPNFVAVFMNPYNGEFIKKQKTIGKGSFDFFRFVIEGHRYLWLPRDVGKYVVNISILVFVISLLSGLFLWWPKNLKKIHLRNAFRIHWRANWKKLTYDLHNVLGFYTLIFTLALALTGLVIGLQWFANTVHFVASGGTPPSYEYPQSVVPKTGIPKEDAAIRLDRAWEKVMAKEKGQDAGMYVGPDISLESAPIVFWVYHHSGSFYDRSTYYFDQYSLKRIHTSKDHYVNADFADKLSMLNYDIHIGSALGLTGKILAFLFSLIGASLPVTGFLYWYNKPAKTRK